MFKVKINCKFSWFLLQLQKYSKYQQKSKDSNGHYSMDIHFTGNSMNVKYMNFVRLQVFLHENIPDATQMQKIS